MIKLSRIYFRTPWKFENAAGRRRLSVLNKARWMPFTKGPDDIMTETFNQMGYSVDILDPYTAYFLHKMRKPTQPVADLGCGFGIVTKHLLNAGATVIANDISRAHLAEVEDSVPREQRSRLTIVHGDASQLDFPANSLSGIMAGRWVHFLTSPEAYFDFFHRALRWLEPGGSLCVTVHTMKAWSPPEVCAAYEIKRASGMAWPGWVSREMKWEGLRDRLPDRGYAFRLEELKGLVEEIGFHVEKCGLYGLRIPAHPPERQVELAPNNTIGIVASKSISLT
ncbi:uncharacterized protein LOC129596413 [Paramacrobiotus metropolitanus]|uniref:uncharacterized protein LOC129596413 n=1 Tax=Paramacrobiotus metropolitanus TaxID=2943436 RepID=UPI002445EA85|nr:uncharacterized protein LOC129596413 [Paramacrobiotus metropolitanus]